MSTNDPPTAEPSCELDRLADRPDEYAAALRGRVPPADGVATAEIVFAALANETRLRIVEALRDGELCGCELEVALDVPQSTVATHLRRLKAAGLVTSRQDGHWRYYRLADTAALQLSALAASVEVEV